jgi:hypothetical protein
MIQICAPDTGPRGIRGVCEQRVVSRWSRCKKPQGVESPFKIGNGYGLLVGRGDQGCDEHVEKLAMAACDGEWGRLRRAKMTIDEVIERAKGEIS